MQTGRPTPVCVGRAVCVRGDDTLLRVLRAARFLGVEQSPLFRTTMFRLCTPSATVYGPMSAAQAWERLAIILQYDAELSQSAANEYVQRLWLIIARSDNQPTINTAALVARVREDLGVGAAEVFVKAVQSRLLDELKPLGAARLCLQHGGAAGVSWVLQGGVLKHLSNQDMAELVGTVQAHGANFSVTPTLMVHVLQKLQPRKRVVNPEPVADV